MENTRVIPEVVLSPVAQDHVARPRNAGKLECATHVGYGGTPGEGPYVVIWLEVEENKILRTGYQCNGCPSSTAVGSVATMLLTGRTLQQASLIEANDLLIVLGGLPEGKSYYADLAFQAIQQAIQNKIQG